MWTEIQRTIEESKAENYIAETNVHVFYQQDSGDFAIRVDGREMLHLDNIPQVSVAKHEALHLRDSIGADHVYFTDKDGIETEL